MASRKDNENTSTEIEDSQSSQQQQQASVVDDDSDPLLEQVKCRMPPQKMAHAPILMFKISVQKSFIIPLLSISADTFFAGTSLHSTNIDMRGCAKRWLERHISILAKVNI
jgi:hypothetical protein